MAYSNTMLTFALALLLPLVQQAETGHLSCGGQVTHTPEGISRCTEKAVVEYEDIRVEADWIEFNQNTRQVTAGDRVKFTQGEDRINGGKLSFNVETKTGTLTDVSGQAEGFYLKAGEYERLPNGDWHVLKLSATACTGECPRWGFTFSEAVVTPGKEFTGRKLTFRVRNVPILWFPKLTIPSEKRERASGFLIPGYSKSTTKGNSIRGAYFWAMDRSYDLTFVGEYFAKRGPTGTIDFHAMPNASTRIDVSEFFAIDRLHQGGQRTRIHALSDLNRDWRGVANVDITSNFPFRQVFEEGFNVISSPLEQSIGFLTRNGSRSSLNILYNRSAVFFPSPSPDLPPEGTTVVMRKFPAVDLQLPTNSIATGRIPIYFSFNSGITGMARRDSQISTPAFMQRVDFHPSVEIPVLRSSALSWSHRVGVRDTFYTHSIRADVTQRAMNRAVFDYTMSIAGPELERSFGSWKHVLEPTIDYRYVTGADRFRQTVVVDETDLVTNTNEVEYGITSRFYGKHEFLTWRVAQKLYFDPTFGGALLAGRRNVLNPLMDLTGFAFSDGQPRRLSPVVSTFRIATTPDTSTDIQVDYDTKKREFRSAGIMGGVRKSFFNSSVGYFFNKRTEIQEPNNQLRAVASLGSSSQRGFSAAFAFSYDIHNSIFQSSVGQVNYNAECYGLSFELSQVDFGFRREVGWRISLSLKNLGTIGNLRPQERLF
jgi:LPS-assembly protein